MSAASIAGSAGGNAQLPEEARVSRSCTSLAPPACGPVAVGGCRLATSCCGVRGRDGGDEFGGSCSSSGCASLVRHERRRQQLAWLLTGVAWPALRCGKRPAAMCNLKCAGGGEGAGREAAAREGSRWIGHV